MYAWLRPLLFVLPAEGVHRLALTLLRLVTAWAPLRRLVAARWSVRDPILATTVFGVDFPAPLGLAAGFDKDAEAVAGWGPMGFGFAEVGTVTAQAQPGNPRPRLFRLPADRALINRMGFNNRGAAAAADILRARRAGVPVGANIGKTKTVALQLAAADYAASAALVAPVADFVVVNVSSPNTPGLRDLQAVAALRPVLEAVLAVAGGLPVLVKVAPDASDEDIDAVADLAVELGVAGIVATNTSIGRDTLVTGAAEVAAVGAGGVSGPPVAQRSLEVLRRLYGRVGGRLVLVSVGGIETADDAFARILAGASLLEGFTGLVYGGPGWAHRLHIGLAALLRAHGYTSVAAAVGAGDSPTP